ncbi:MAG TPA: tetratricopeptide repeat protein [Fimbriimonadaceae bacterium]|nr:tetratricopeptide repeat protein [Fimbriimonadaceae bacterium]
MQTCDKFRAHAIVSGERNFKFVTSGERPSLVGGKRFLSDSTFTARTMYQTYDWKGALENCSKVLEHDPDHLGALEVQAQALWFAGRYADVVRTTNRMLSLNPSEPGYRYTRGMALMSMGQLSRAADDFRQALVQSDDPRFLNQVQNALMAIEEFQRGGVDRIARLAAMRVRRRGEVSGPTDTTIN